MSGILRFTESLGNYTQTHEAAVTILNMLGLRLDRKRRLDVFRLIVKLDREYSSRPEYPEGRRLLERLVRMRERGLEPKHKNGVYLPRSLDDLL